MKILEDQRERKFQMTAIRDLDKGQWLVTEEYKDGYDILGQFHTRKEAQAFLREYASDCSR